MNGLHIIVRTRPDGQVERFAPVLTDAEFLALPLIGRYGITQGTGLRAIHFGENEKSKRTAYIEALPITKESLTDALVAAEKIEQAARRSMRWAVQGAEGEILATAPTKGEAGQLLRRQVRIWRRASSGNSAPRLDELGYVYRFQKRGAWVDTRQVIRLYE